MSVHLIHRSAPRHAALRDLLPDGGPAPLPRKRRSWRAGVLEVVELLLFLVGLHPAIDEAGAGFDSPDILDAPPATSAVHVAGVQLPRVRPGHVHIPHLPRPHVPVVAGRILHRGPRPATAPGLAHVAPAAGAVPAVPTVPTAAGPTIGLYLPGDDPRTTTAQLHALAESALAALDLHYQAVREACGRLDALALTPLPSEQPEPPRPPTAPPALCAPVRPPAMEYPPFATGSRRAPAPDGRTRYGQNALGATTPPARHAGRAADIEFFGSAR